MKEYDNQGNLKCEHDFMGGLCTKCLCPETDADTQRAINALDNMASLTGRFSEVLGYAPTRAQAVVLAWQSHRRQA